MTITIALFNNKGGVGKTTLAYHLAHMMTRIGNSVLVADFDPQANLTSMFFEEDQLTEIWESSGGTVFDALQPVIRRTGDVVDVTPFEVAEGLLVLPGDLGLARFEDTLSQAWPGTIVGTESELRVTTALHRILHSVVLRHEPDFVVLDVGPNLGAINRSALLSSDFIVVPLAADLFSLQGLRNLGPALGGWRKKWSQVVTNAEVDLDMPAARMEPLGYVVLQHAVRLDRPVKAYRRWLDRIPGEFHQQLLGQEYSGTRPDEDPRQLGTVRNYRSLMPLAHDARKPMFDLKAADGALGSTARFVQTCYDEFEQLARVVVKRARAAA